ncbi:hypothetical protein ACWFQ8_30035 [Streptomyces sp. NPDC055254]
MSARDELLHEYGRADTAPLGTLAELRNKLDACRAEALADFVDRCAIALAGCCPECDAATAIVRGRIEPTLDGAPVPERTVAAEGKGTGTTGGEPTPATGFFQAGRTYTDGNGYRAPEITAYFHVEHVTRHPDRGHLRAIGWVRSGAPGARWHGHFVDEGDFEGWTELGKPLIAAAPAVEPGPAGIGDERALKLADHILNTGGIWTSGKAHRWLSSVVTPAPALHFTRHTLQALAAHGYLIERREPGRVSYTPNYPKEC